MGYVDYIRQYVGHRMVMIAGTAVLLHDSEGRILMQRRVDNGLWGIAGGCIEPDESVEDAARREMFEETGLVAGELTLYGAFGGKGFRHLYPNGDECSIISIVYICRDFSGEMKAQESEVAELHWFAPSEIPPREMLSPVLENVITEYAKKCADEAIKQEQTAS